MRNTLAVALLGWLLFSPACGSARRGEPLVGPKEIPNPAVALGQRVFATHCSQCHPGGERGIGPALNDKPLPGWLIKFQVRNGLGAMPSFSSDEIGGEELDALVEYLVWLRRLERQTGGE